MTGEIVDLIGGSADDVLHISAKTGRGRRATCSRRSSSASRRPAGEPDAPPRALIFDSEFDQYRGVVAYVRAVDGAFRKDEPIRAMQAGTQAEIDEIGFFKPAMTPAPAMEAGEVGYVITGIKDVTKLRVGDTLTTTALGRPPRPLPGYREVKPMVFCGLFPIDTDRYEDLREALDRLSLNDAALSWEPETSQALGFGFRCGFLGLLHMDIVRERLEREYDLDLLATTPNVSYEVELIGGEVVEVHSPVDLPDPGVDRRDPRALHPRERDLPGRPRRRGDGALPGAPRHPRRHALPLARARPAPLRPAARRRSSSTSSTSSSRGPRATRRSTTSRSACGRRTS